MNNYPECNGFYHDDRSYKKPRVDQRPRGSIIRERSDERRTHVHDQLGGRVSVRDPVGGRIPADERLEQMANDRVKDDQPLRSDPERESQFMIILIGLSGVQRV